MKRQNFNAGWIFYSKDEPQNKKTVHLPHDAMIYEKRVPRLKNGALFGYFPSGDYYYEKLLFGKDEYRYKTVILEFEGIYMDSHVFLNDEEVGGHIYGYSNFYVDLTGKLKIGQDNLIKVLVHNSQVPNGRWYTGSGIYRPVKLIVAEKEHIDLDGVKVITRSYSPAVLDVTVKATRSDDCEIRTDILYDDVIVATGTGEHCEIPVPDAHLWDAEHPHLYQAKVTLLRKGRLIDEDVQRFGIRKIEWNAKQGLLINGNSIKLRGGCVHHDNGPLGACSFEAAEYRRVRILKESGYNAIRGAHDPKSKAMLDACDELGMYVMEEAFDVWFENNGTYGYVLYFRDEWEKDLQLMVEKCLNHPSVIMYSIGNEISECNTPEGVEYGKKMVRVCHDIDDSRPVTMGVNLMLNVLQAKGIKISPTKGKEFHKDDVVDPKSEEPDGKMSGSVMINIMVSVMGGFMKGLSKPKPSDKATREIFSLLDIAGYNYGDLSYERHHEWYPERVMVGTETQPDSIFDRWALVKKHPYLVGDFVWTSWDYLGECGVGVVDYDKNTGSYSKPYPVIIAGCGTHDITGFRDTHAYQSAAVWGVYDKPYIASRHPKNYTRKTFYGIGYRKTDAVPSWTFDGYEGHKTEVQVYSQGHQVELQLNGKSLGRKQLVKCLAKFVVAYAPGRLEAVSYDANGRELARDFLLTAAKETRLNLVPEVLTLKANGEDLAYINVLLTDDAGIVKMDEEKTVHVMVEGAGILQAVGSGAPRTTEEYTGTFFTTYHGRMIAIVRSGYEKGEITVTFSSESLKEQVVKIRVE